jgi:serine/threonine protein kinase
MPLAPRTRLGPYEVIDSLGSGGMGEVYRGRDTRLDRTVAIKVLAAGTAGDADLRGRFVREAKAVAALEHPHICGVYDVGEADGILYLVMPLIDGQTLAARLEAGPLPVGQLLFQTRVPVTGNAYLRSYEVSPDGQRFLVNTMPADAQQPVIHVVLDWRALLASPR